MQENIFLTEALTKQSNLDKYNYWQYERIQSNLGKRVLEIGAGIGIFTQLLTQNGREVTATDVLPNYCSILEEKFANAPKIKVRKFDLSEGAPEEFTSQPFDSIVCLNVLEHIEDDKFALKQMNDCLVSGGKLCLLVPAHQFLYGEFDRTVGHYRRYEKKDLKNLLSQSNFIVRHMEYFNIVAAIPWLINGRLLKRTYIPTNQVNLADKLVPILRLEKYFGPPYGISLIAIAEKT